MISVLDYVEHLSNSLHPLLTIYRAVSFIHRFTRQGPTSAHLTLSLDDYRLQLDRHQQLLSQILLQVEGARHVADTELDRMRVERDFIACQAELAKSIWTNENLPAPIQQRAMLAWSELNITWAKRFPEALALNASTPVLVFRPLPLPG